MDRIVTATEAKATILALLDDVANGDTVQITKHGRLVAKLVPASSPAGLRDRFAGAVVSVEDEERLFSTEAEWSLG